MNAATLGKVILILVVSFGTMTVYESCCGIPDFPYYEITSAEALVEDTSLTSGDTLKVVLHKQEFKYLSGTSLFSNAYAWTCDTNGYLGPKHAYSQLIITSENAFDAAHPAGASLNDLFFLTSLGNDRILLTDVMTNDSVLQRVIHDFYQLETSEQPDSQGSFEFLIEFKNTVGSRVLVKTPPITWN